MSTPLQITGSRHLTAWLAAQNVSLAVTAYQSGKVFLIGRKPDDTLAVFERTFNRAMGLWSDGQTIWLATAFQLWRFANVLAPGQTDGDFDRLYVPRTGLTTGDLDAHDIAPDADGWPVFVSTRFSCLATPSETHGFAPVWRPPFVSKLAAEDRCHLNGLAMMDGKPAYVTACATSDVADGWRERRRDGGCVADVRTNAVVLDGLSMPHSPRWHGGKLWLLDSGNGYLGRVEAGRFERVAFCPGYARGLAFAGDFALVGLSRPRREGTFGGLALDDELKSHGAVARSGVQVVDLRTGDVAHWLRMDGVDELYDVAVLPGVVRPTLLGFKTDDIRFTVTAEGHPGVIWRAMR